MLSHLKPMGVSMLRLAAIGSTVDLLFTLKDSHKFGHVRSGLVHDEPADDDVSKRDCRRWFQKIQLKLVHPTRNPLP